MLVAVLIAVVVAAPLLVEAALVVVVVVVAAPTTPLWPTLVMARLHLVVMRPWWMWEVAVVYGPSRP